MFYDVYVRYANTSDLDRIFTIESENSREEWDEDRFKQILLQANGHGIVAEINNEVVGFMIYEMHAKKYNIVNFAVSSKYRNYGVGSAIIQYMVNKLGQFNRNCLMLAVSEKNLRAQLFFKRHNFKAIYVLPNFYDKYEDAYAMVRYRAVNTKTTS